MFSLLRACYALCGRLNVGRGKAVVDYSGYADGGLAGPAHKAHDGLNLHAATFGTLTFPLSQFSTDITDYETKLADSLKGGTDRTTLKNDARAKLEDECFNTAPR